MLPCNPDISERSVLSEGILQLVLGGVVAQVADVDFAGDIPVAMARHF